MMSQLRKRENDQSSIDNTVLYGPELEDFGEAAHIIPISTNSPSRPKAVRMIGSLIFNHLT